MPLEIVRTQKSSGTPFHSFLFICKLYVSANSFINALVQIQPGVLKRLPIDKSCSLMPFIVHNYASLVMNW
jgi:hypothetical protein